MDYAKIYQSLVSRGFERTKSGYMERHHVLPRCLGGTNSTANLVWLTPEEHYVAHLLLVKIHPGNAKLLWAVTCMTGSNSRMQRTNKLYGWARRKFGQVVGLANRGRKHTEHSRANMSRGQKGLKRPSSAARNEAISKGNAGKPKSAEHRAALALAALKRPKRGPHSEIHKQRQSIAIKETWARRKAALQQERAA